MMTDVVVAPSLGGLLVGCVLLLTGTVPVVLFAPTVMVDCMLLLTERVPVVAVAPTVLVGCVLLLTGAVPVGVTVWRGVANVISSDAVERECTT